MITIFFVILKLSEHTDLSWWWIILFIILDSAND